MIVPTEITNDLYRYFNGDKCRSCDYVAKSPDDEIYHIQHCPVNPHPGYRRPL